MRALILMGWLVAGAAHAEDGVGLGVDLLARAQPGGTSFITASPQLRYQHDYLPQLALAVTYAFAFQPAGSAWGMEVNTHALAGRAVSRLPLRWASVDLEVGPSLELRWRTVRAEGTPSTTGVGAHLGVASGLYVSVPLGQAVVRLGYEAQVHQQLDQRFAFAVLWRWP